MNLVPPKNAASAPVELDRLPILAAEINNTHANITRHIKTTITTMMAAGDLLLAAKALVRHGKWLVWLRANCPDVSERSAHLYMRFARYRATIEDAMVKSAMVADLERDQLLIPRGLAVGPFGVVDAIAAINEAERYEQALKEQWSKRANGFYLGPATRYPEEKFHPSDLSIEVESFSNHLKCCLSRIGTDPLKRAEFLKQARACLDAIERGR